MIKKTISFLLPLTFIVFYSTAALSNEHENSSKLLFENKCSRCHGLEKITQAIKTPEQWSITVNRMREKDTNWINPEEALTISAYLASNFSLKNPDDYNSQDHSNIPPFLPELFGLITFCLLLATVVLGFIMTHGKRKLFKIHRVIAYTTLASGVIHVVLILITH